MVVVCIPVLVPPDGLRLPLGVREPELPEGLRRDHVAGTGGIGRVDVVRACIDLRLVELYRGVAAEAYQLLDLVRLLEHECHHVLHPKDHAGQRQRAAGEAGDEDIVLPFVVELLIELADRLQLLRHLPVLLGVREAQVAPLLRVVDAGVHDRHPPVGLMLLAAQRFRHDVGAHPRVNEVMAEAVERAYLRLDEHVGVPDPLRVAHILLLLPHAGQVVPRQVDRPVHGVEHRHPVRFLQVDRAPDPLTVRHRVAAVLHRCASFTISSHSERILFQSQPSSSLSAMGGV